MFDNTEFLQLNSKFYKLMMIKRTLFFVVVLLVLSGSRIFNKLDFVPNWMFVTLILVVIIVAILVVRITKTIFNKKQYLVHDKNLSYKKGLIVHSLTVIPFSRIQHIEIDEGPLERIFKLSSISIFTAGDSGRDLKISGLNQEESIRIKEFVTNIIRDEEE